MSVIEQLSKLTDYENQNDARQRAPCNYGRPCVDVFLKSFGSAIIIYLQGGWVVKQINHHVFFEL